MPAVHDPRSRNTPIRVLLATLSWLTVRQRHAPDLTVQCAIAYHLHLLILHPASDGLDIQAGLVMAGRTGLDAAGLLARHAGASASLQ